MGHFQKKGTEDGNIYNMQKGIVGLWDSGTLPKERDRRWEYIIYIQVVWDCGTVGHIQKKGTEDGNI